MHFRVRTANINDLVQIYQLYTKAYGGTYPDPIFSDMSLLKRVIKEENRFVFVAVDEKDDIIASLLFLYDPLNFLAKATGGVVDPYYRGQNITQKLIKHGIDFLEKSGSRLDIIYVTTRTIHKAAQVLTQNMGFKQLGVFPNVHKTNEYETHALAALYFHDSLKKRFVDFEQHPKVLPLFNIVRDNIDLPAMEKSTIWPKKNFYGEVPDLEIIEAEKFIQLRSKKLKDDHEIDLAFFPFHTPNILITSPTQSIEVFAFVNEVDKHCVITGCKIDREVSFTDLFMSVGQILRDRGIRYIEIIIRANRLNIIEKIINARYLPCAYVPAFQLQEDKRYDYVVFSKPFEILDFNNLQLTGASQVYLRNYIKLWEETFLGDFFKD